MAPQAPRDFLSAPIRCATLRYMNLSMRKALLRSAISLACLSMILPILAPCGRAEASSSPKTVPASYRMDKDREPMVLLDGFWRFHPGDDSHWADPGFDDSQWPLIRADKSWNEQGYPKLSGFAWYRARLLIPEGENDLSLSIPQVLTSDQVYADGKLIGGFGGMPPHPYPITQFLPLAVYRLPSAPVGHARSVVIAVRVWDWPAWESKLGAGITKGVRIGETPLVQNSIATSRNTLSLNQASNVFLAILEILAGLAALAFFALRLAETEYLWFSIVMLFAAGLYLGPTFYLRGHLDVRTWGLLLGVLQSGFGFAQLAFFLRLLKGRRSWLFWLAVASVSASLPVPIGASLRAMGWRYFPAFSLVQWNAIMVALGLPLTIWILSLLFRQAVKRRFDARLLLAPVLLQQLASLTDSLLWFGRFMLGWRPESYAWFRMLSNSPFPFSVPNVCDLLFLVGMLAIFVLRFTRTSRQEDAHQRELEAARTVQQVLIPEKIPDVPGFQIECVYLSSRTGRGRFLPGDDSRRGRNVGRDRGRKWQGYGRSHDREPAGGHGAHACSFSS